MEAQVWRRLSLVGGGRRQVEEPAEGLQRLALEEGRLQPGNMFIVYSMTQTNKQTIIKTNKHQSRYLGVRVHLFVRGPVRDSVPVPPPLPLSFVLSLPVPALVPVSVPVSGSLAVFPSAAVVRGHLGAPLEGQVFLSVSTNLINTEILFSTISCFILCKIKKILYSLLSQTCRPAAEHVSDEDD